MAVETGYSKIVTSGSVFLYDTGDTVNSYKGEPTTNLVPYSEYQYLPDNYTDALPGWDTYEGSFLIDPINKVPGYTNRSIKMTCVQANVYKYHFSVPLTNGQTYTVSFWGKAQVATNYSNFLLADGPGGYLVFEPGGYSSVTTNFTRFQYTFTVTSPTGTYNFATYLYGDGSVVWLSGFQLENKSHATQYLVSNGSATTRSNTQGLLDISGIGNTITLANMSYDSNAQMVFDGTNNYIDFGDVSGGIGGSSQATMELVINMTFPNALQQIFGFRNNTTFDFFFLVFGGGGTEFRVRNTAGTIYDLNPSISAYSGKPVHIVFTVGPNGRQVYVNGVVVATDPIWTGTLGSSAPFNIGRNSGNFWFANGTMPVAKLYNRALSPSEVLTNFNHYKTRFNIT